MQGKVNENSEEKSERNDENDIELIDPNNLSDNDGKLYDYIRNNDCIILIDEDRNFNHIKIGSKMKKKIGKTWNMDTDKLINKQYGTVFQLNGNDIVFSKSKWISHNEYTNINDINYNESKDNSLVNPLNSKQKLDQNEILKLKNDNNIDNNVLINKIANNNNNFNKKTEFSKEKYIKKKKKKHSKKYMIIKANSFNLTEMYFNRNPNKTMALRLDTISQIVTQANVHSNQNILIMDDCLGLVIGYLCEIMGGYGKIYNGYVTEYPNTTILNDMYDLSLKHKSIVVNFHLGLLNDNTSDDELKTICDKTCMNKAFKKPNLYDIKSDIINNNCDSLILCCKYDKLVLIKYLWKYLNYGCPFVIFDQQIESLKIVYQYIMSNGLGFLLKLYDNFFREIQVLPQRTHPHMNMNQLGGYILCGYKVYPKPTNIKTIDDEISEPPPQKAKT